MTQKIVIVGDGLAALTAALVLAERGLKDVCVIGPRLKLSTKKATSDTTKIDGRSTAIFQAGLGLLQQIGVWPLPKNAYAPLPTMLLKRDDGAEILFEALRAGFDNFGANITNHVLWQALLAKVLAHKNIQTIADMVAAVDLPTDATQNYAQLTTAQGQTLPAALVLGADGRQSVVRCAANIEMQQKPNPNHQTALVAKFKHTTPHNNVCVEWQRAGGPFTVVPLPNPYQSALVWCEPQNKHDNFLEQDTTLQCAELSYLTDNYFGDVLEITDIGTWPVQPQHAQKLTAPRVWLLGEAAHILPPLAAQGFNLSLTDIAVIADLLVAAQAVGQDVGDYYLAQKYQQARGFDMGLRYIAMTLANQALQAEGVVMQQGQSLAFRTLQKLPFVKKQLMRWGGLPFGTKAAI